MDTPETKTNNIDNKLLAIPLFVVIAIGLLLAFIGISEFYNVKFGGLESAYAFGAGDNAHDWLYKTASHYSNYMLLGGLSFLAVSIVAIIGVLKRQRKITIVTVILILLMLVIDRAV